MTMKTNGQNRAPVTRPMFRRSRQRAGGTRFVGSQANQGHDKAWPSRIRGVVRVGGTRFVASLKKLRGPRRSVALHGAWPSRDFASVPDSTIPVLCRTRKANPWTIKGERILAIRFSFVSYCGCRARSVRMDRGGWRSLSDFSGQPKQQAQPDSIQCAAPPALSSLKANL